MLDLRVYRTKLEKELTPVFGIRGSLEKRVGTRLPNVGSATNFKEEVERCSVECTALIRANVEHKLVSV